MAFLSLPSELRLNVYGCILSTVNVPTSVCLRPYQGLFMACIQIHQEFEAEILNVVNQHLFHLKNLFPFEFCSGADSNLRSTKYPMQVPIVTSLADTVNIKIGLPVPDQSLCMCSGCRKELSDRGWWFPLEHAIRNLLYNFCSFSLYPYRVAACLWHPPPDWVAAKHQFYIKAGALLRRTILVVLKPHNIRRLDGYPNISIGTFEKSTNPEPTGICLLSPNGGVMIKVDMNWHARKLEKCKELVDHFDPLEQDEKLELRAYLEDIECRTYANRLAHACDDFWPYESTFGN